MRDEYEPTGECEVCGLTLDDDPEGDHDANHRLCWRHWRAEYWGDDVDDDDDEEEAAA